jgi:hypothetical protein
MTTPTLIQQRIPASKIESGDTLVDTKGQEWRVMTWVWNGSGGKTITIHNPKTHQSNTISPDADKEITVLRPESFSQEKRDAEIKQREEAMDVHMQQYGPDSQPHRRAPAATEKYGNVPPPPPPPAPQEAARTVTDALGGQVVAVESAEAEHARQTADATGVAMPLPLWEQMSEPERLTHLYLIHGVWGYDVTRPGEITDLHDAAHKAEQTITPHEHVEGLR